MNDLVVRLDRYIAHKRARTTLPVLVGRSHAPALPAPRPFIGSPRPEAVGLGRLVDPGGIGDRIRYGGDQHVLLFGPNGKGKGTRVLIPNLLQMHGDKSVVVVDPKGELAAVTAPHRRRCGDVVILNPFNVLVDIPGYEDLRGSGFNPLGRLDPAAPSFNREAAQLADALIVTESKDPHWSHSARALFAMMIMVAAIRARAAGHVPTIAQVRELICLPSGGDPENNIPYYGIPAVAEWAMQQPITGLRNKAAQFLGWNREIQSIASTAKIQTEPFDDDEIAADLAIDGFDFRQLKLRPTTVYLILPPEEMGRHSKWLRLVLTAAIQSSLRARRPGESRVMFMLDEFFALGHLEIISTVWALVRGYGISMMPVLQDMGQLKKLYPDMWETFIGMAGAVMSFAPNDLTTSDWLSRRAGEGMRMISTTSVSEGESGGSSTGGQGSTNSGWSKSETTNYSQMKAPLVSGHKLIGLPPGFLTLTLDGLSNLVPIYAPPYWDIEQCAARARDNPYFLG